MPDAQIASSPKAFSLDYAPRGLWLDEQLAWLRALRIGAAVTGSAFVISGTWSFAVLCMRVRGVPTPGQIQSIWPFESLAVMVLTWAGVWLLSTSQPDGRAARIPGVLRLLVTVECLLLSLQRLGLLEDIALVRRWSEPAQYACDVLVAALLGAHLCLVSSRLRLGGVGWRIGLALPLRAGVVLAMLLVPRLISAFIAAPYRLSWEFWNFRSALFVLTAGLCALAMFRFALALRRSAASG